MVRPNTAIDRWDADQPLGHALILPNPAMSAITRRDWDLFHGTLVREAALTRATYPVQRAVLQLLLQLSAKTAAAALVQVRAVLDATDARVAAPVTLPAGNRSPIPPLAAMPPAYADIVREMQMRLTAALCNGFI